MSSHNDLNRRGLERDGRQRHDDSSDGHDVWRREASQRAHHLIPERGAQPGRSTFNDALIEQLNRHAFTGPGQRAEDIQGRSSDRPDRYQDTEEAEGKDFKTPGGSYITHGIKAEYDPTRIDEIMSDYYEQLADPQVAGRAHPIETLGPDSKFYNCHSFSLTHSCDTWLPPEDNPVGKVLSSREFGFHYVDESRAGQGDLYVYRDGNRDILHSGRVIGRDQYNQLWVRSRWGAGPLTDHVHDAVPANFRDEYGSVNGECWQTNHPSRGYLD